MNEYLPESLLAKGYGAKAYDIEINGIIMAAETPSVDWIYSQGINAYLYPYFLYLWTYLALVPSIAESIFIIASALIRFFLST